METKGEITCSRWKPTKRQIEILEELFRQVHCNPSRSSINEFTNLLKQHGNVEAKNVFYWFQNTHARNKRKQKRQTRQMQQSPTESTPRRQNTQPRNKRKQKRQTRQMQQSPTESTPQRQNEKDIVKSLQGQSYSCPTKADGIIFDSSTIMAQFPVQGHTNSPDSATSMATQKLLPMDLSVKQHLQYVGNETFSKVDGFRSNIWNKAALRNDGWAHHLTDPGRSNVMTNCSGGPEHEKKDELLELFPLHPDGNLRSKCLSSFHDYKDTNNIRPERGEWALSLKFVP